MIRVLLLAVLLLGGIVAPALAQAEVKVALVIGNSDYASGRVPDLANPRNDAEDVVRALREFGFEATLEQDLDKDGMIAAISDFAEKARNADIALFYYAGHGMQLDLRNYLVPTDAEFETADDVVNRSVPLDSLTASTEGMKGALLIFIDACQENPLGQRDGLARIPVSANQFVALAALPDMKAADGTGRNSPFTEAFLTNAGVPGRTISDVMLQVRLDVLATTGSQVPWDNSSLTQQIVFVPGDNSAELPPETMLWRTASSLGDVTLINAYLSRFPDGPHADDARMLLASVEPDDLAMRALTPGPESTGGEEALWQLAFTSRWPPLLEVYVSRYPEGSHVQEARDLLAILPNPDAPDASPEITCERLTTHPNDETPQFPGVPSARLRENAAAAIEACRIAHNEFPDIHKYTSFLARALYLGGEIKEAIALFTEAADAGNIRAMTTLGAIYETGTGPTEYPGMAADYYQRAASAGANDAAVNLARMLAEGTGVQQDLPKAVSLLRDASSAGSLQAAFNLGVLALNNQGVPEAEARSWFGLASDRGFVEGHFRAALLYESADLGPRDVKRAAEYALRAIAADSGNMLRWIEDKEVVLGDDTISELQSRLSALGYYTGAIDGELGPGTLSALRKYRFGGLDVPPG
jgi:hypothetical protein